MRLERGVQTMKTRDELLAIARQFDKRNGRSLGALMCKLSDSDENASPAKLACALWKAKLIELGEYLSVINRGFDFETGSVPSEKA